MVTLSPFSSRSKHCVQRFVEKREIKDGIAMFLGYPFKSMVLVLLF